jgi:peptide/nickel transport system substrate-binding protein
MAALLCASACTPAPVAPTPTPTTMAAAAPTAGATAPAKPAAPGAVPTAPTSAAAGKAVAEQPRRGGILKVALSGDPVSFDIHQEPSILSLEPLAPAYNGLVMHDSDEPEKIVGDLAERYEISPDGLVYTFYFRPNIKWHDGQPFAAEDARYSFERMRKPPAGVLSIRSPELTFVSKLETPDDRTLKITLTQPYYSFLEQLATDWFLVMPKHILETKGHMKSEVVGTGPFMFKSYTKGVSLELVRNPNYFKAGLPYLDGITFLLVSNAATRVAALRTGQAHLTGRSFASLEASDAELLKKESPSVRIQEAPGYASPWFHMNTLREPLNDVRVRRAIWIGFNRQTSIKVLADDLATLGTFVPPGTWGIPEPELLKLPGYRQPKSLDIAEAKKLLSEAGLPTGFKTSILCRDVVARACEFWQAQLETIGIAATIDVKESGPIAELQRQSKFDLLASNNTFRFNDPDDVGRKWVTGAPQNYTGYSNPEVDRLMAQQQGTADLPTRVKLVRQIDDILMAEAPTINPFWDTKLIGLSVDLRGHATPPGQYSLLRREALWLAK